MNDQTREAVERLQSLLDQGGPSCASQWAGKVAPALRKALAALSEAEEQVKYLEARVLRPGVMRCAKCDFRLIRNMLYVQSGNIGAGTSESEPCPNGCGPLWPVTWKDECQAADKCWSEQVERANALEAERDALKARIAAHAEETYALNSEIFALTARIAGMEAKGVGTADAPSAALAREIPKPCYSMSEPHLSGWRVVLGYENLKDAQDAQETIARGFLQVVPAPVSDLLPGGVDHGGVGEQSVARDALARAERVEEALREAIDHYIGSVHAHSRDGHCDTVDDFANIKRWRAALSPAPTVKGA